MPEDADLTAVPGGGVYTRRIPEIPVEGKPLGRHIQHDPRSLAYAWQHTGATPVTVLHPRRVPILNQLRVGSCTGNAMTGALGTDPVYEDLPAGHATLNEAEALKLYSAAEVIDGGQGYPPEDEGSSGLSVAKAAKAAGLIAGYQHCLTVDAIVDALQAGPVLIGISWYTSFDQTDANGLVEIAPGATVRGGHEVVLRGVDVEAKLFHADNSWGTSYGRSGSFSFSWETMARLLAEHGDATVPVPLSQPAPTPPAPVPAPAPAIEFPAQAAKAWLDLHHTGSNLAFANVLRSWMTAEGYPV